MSVCRFSHFNVLLMKYDSVLRAVFNAGKPTQFNNCHVSIGFSDDASFHGITNLRILIFHRLSFHCQPTVNHASNENILIV